jgi:hypothetical protein
MHYSKNGERKSKNMRAKVGESSPEPKERSPSMGSGVDESTSKDDSEQVAECVSLLKHTGDQTTCFKWNIFECCGCCVAVQSTHGNAKACANAEELLKGLAETGTLTQDIRKVGVIVS